MALTNCPDCNTEVSPKAESCPKCGFPMKHAPFQSGSSHTCFGHPVRYKLQKTMKVQVSTAILFCAILIGGFSDRAFPYPGLEKFSQAPQYPEFSLPLAEFFKLYRGEWYGLPSPWAGAPISARFRAMTFPSASLSVQDDVVITVEGRCQHRLVPVEDEVTQSGRAVYFESATNDESCFGSEIVRVLFTPVGLPYPHSPIGVRVQFRRDEMIQFSFQGQRPTEPEARRQELEVQKGKGLYFAFPEGRGDSSLDGTSRNELITRAMNTLETQGWTCLSQVRRQLLPGDRLRFEVEFAQEYLGFLVECEGDCSNLVFGVAPGNYSQPLRYDGITYGFPFLTVPSHTFFTKQLLIWAEQGHGVKLASQSTMTALPVRITKWTTERFVSGPGCSASRPSG